MNSACRFSANFQNVSNTGVTLSFLLAEIRISRPALFAIGVTDASDGGLEQLSGDASPNGSAGCEGSLDTYSECHFLLSGRPIAPG